MRKGRIFFVGAVVIIFGVALFTIRVAPAKRLTESALSETRAEVSSVGKVIPAPSFTEFTIVAQEVFQPGNGPLVRGAQSTYYSRADGVFATVRIASGDSREAGTPEVTVGEPGRGVFQVNQLDRKLVFIGPLPEDTTAPLVEDLRRSEQYQGEATVLGYPTIILRKQRRDFYIDTYYAPDFQLVIKTITVTQQGTTTIEPASIIPGPSDNTIFTSLADFSIDTSSYRVKLEKAERVQGEAAVAEELRRHLEKASSPRTRF